MLITLREAIAADAPMLGKICFEAFESVANAHCFVRDFPNAEVATGMVGWMIGNPGFYGVVAELDGQVVGSNFLDERGVIAGVGPISVSPKVQNKSIGRDLMLAVIERSQQKNYTGVRLLQSAYHNRSLSLYAKLGFNQQEAFAVIQGPAIKQSMPGYEVRQAGPADMAACNAICRYVHGHDRAGELSDAVTAGQAIVVESFGRIVGYSTGLAFLAHSVAESDDAMIAMISSAEAFGGPGMLVPLNNHRLFRWCLERKLRVVQVMNLMTMGLYNEPKGSYLASVLY